MDQRYNFYNLEASFRNYLLAGNAGISAISVKNYLSDFRHFFGWLILRLKVAGMELNNEDLNDYAQISSLITTDRIQDYVNYLGENDIPVKTINRRLSTLRRFCNFCISQGWMSENQAKRVGNIGSTIKSQQILGNYRKELELEGFTEPQIKQELESVSDFITSFSSTYEG